MTSPLTESDDDSDVESIVMFRISSTDEEWAADEAASRWNLSREEAARRVDEKDYSPLS